MSRVTSQSPPSPDIWRCDIPMWRQAGLISTDLLSLSLLPGHWQYFPRSVHLWTCCSRSSDDCHVPCWPSSTTTQQSIPMGNWPWTTTPSRVHSGQTKEGVPKWSTHHILRWFTLSTYAQHLGQNDRSTHPSGLSKPRRFWWCLHTTWDPSICASWRQFDPGQSRSSWILHQHWPRTLYWSLVHALRLPSAQNGRLWPWGLLSLSWKIQQSGWHHQGSHISSTQRHSKDYHQGCTRTTYHGTQHANIRLGSTLHSPMPRQPHVKSFITSLLSYDCLHEQIWSINTGMSFL